MDFEAGRQAYHMYIPNVSQAKKYYGFTTILLAHFPYLKLKYYSGITSVTIVILKYMEVIL